MDRSDVTLTSLFRAAHRLAGVRQRRKSFLPVSACFRRRVFHFAGFGLLLILTCVISFFLVSYHPYAKIVDARLAHGYLMSRAGIYAAPRTLRQGQKYSVEGLTQLLRSAGYIESEEPSDIWNGTFSAGQASIEIRPNTSFGQPE